MPSHLNRLLDVSVKTAVTLRNLPCRRSIACLPVRRCASKTEEVGRSARSTTNCSTGWRTRVRCWWPIMLSSDECLSMLACWRAMASGACIGARTRGAIRPDRRRVVDEESAISDWRRPNQARPAAHSESAIARREGL